MEWQCKQLTAAILGGAQFARSCEPVMAGETLNTCEQRAVSLRHLAAWMWVISSLLATGAAQGQGDVPIAVEPGWIRLPSGVDQTIALSRSSVRKAKAVAWEGAYGSRRMHRELQGRVHRIGLGRASHKWRYKETTDSKHALPVADRGHLTSATGPRSYGRSNVGPTAPPTEQAADRDPPAWR